MSASNALTAIVLAAGQGTRMRSETPKVLHRIAGRPLAAWPIQAALDAGVARCVVVTGHGRERVETELSALFGDRVAFVHQAQQLGTGHAVRCALSALDGGGGRVLVLYGDCPLLESATLRRLIDASVTSESDLGLVTFRLTDPTGYGRILRDDHGKVMGIREHKDATPDEREIGEVNPGVYAIRLAFLQRTIDTLGTQNSQGEFYLTDLVEKAYRTTGIADIEGDEEELRGVNDRLELANCASVRRRRIVHALARSGVGMDDPNSVYVDADVVVEPDAHLGANVHLRGRTVVRAHAHIDVGCVLEDVVVAAGASLHPYTVASQSTIGAQAEVGPFSHLRAETELGPKSKVGNFTETKKTRLGEGSKVNHLAYVGDGIIGDHVNVGAGTIFCNYDGFTKNTTILEDHVFIGSDSQLVAPVRVGRGAYVASGTTVTRDIPPDALAIARVKQENKEGFAAKLRSRGEAAREARKSKA